MLARLARGEGWEGREREEGGGVVYTQFAHMLVCGLYVVNKVTNAQAPTKAPVTCVCNHVP